MALPLTASADFFDDLDRVDEALRSNPSNVLQQSLQSCKKQRGYAVKLYEMGMTARAERALDYCYESLRISRDDPRTRVTAPSQDELLAKAQREYDLAMAMEADLVNGLKIYRECAACHEPEGWGRTSGSIPQIAGQHDSVIIRQLADFRAGNRDSAMMIPYATAETIGGPQGLADVAAYIGSLEISVENGKGPGTSLDLGEKLYGEHCADCHGASGEGDIENVVPRIQAQHFRYLQRQYEWIRDGKRRNANPEMVEQIQNFSDAEVEAILDYVSRLEPPRELQAPPGWKNPDFQQP
ncbi:MAG: c-type cytochrome [Xanthomonadales bacterium]|nr:c-type cytochrome [Xanthomonadales bacterium]